MEVAALDDGPGRRIRLVGRDRVRRRKRVGRRNRRLRRRRQRRLRAHDGRLPVTRGLQTPRGLPQAPSDRIRTSADRPCAQLPRHAWDSRARASRRSSSASSRSTTSQATVNTADIASPSQPMVLMTSPRPPSASCVAPSRPAREFLHAVDAGRGAAVGRGGMATAAGGAATPDAPRAPAGARPGPVSLPRAPRGSSDALGT